ncbi:MAG: BON domain-containing protein, partial [Planctomycetes bacterium]|nr:BON domain-containing protein [Planctomycetota bacterium]
MFAHPLRSKLLRTLAGVSCLALLGAAGALVAQPPAPAKPTAPVAVADVTLARAALAALDADPVLKDVNLIVSVVDRGAVVGGPVATDEIKKRAEAVIRGVPGIASVKNVCFVQADPDPLLRAVAERMKGGTKPGSAPLPGVALAPTAPEGHLPALPPEPPSDLLAGAPNNSVVAQAPALPPVRVIGGPV